MVGENAFSALQALTQNWFRSLLTMLGITVGMLSIVTLVAILQGVKAEVENQVQGLAPISCWWFRANWTPTGCRTRWQ